LTDVVALATTVEHNLALKADGTVVAWSPPSVAFSPAYVPPDLTNVVAVSATMFSDLALLADGTLRTWNALQGPWSPAAPIPVGLSSVGAVAGNLYTEFAVQSDGTVATWDGVSGALVALPASWTNVVALSAQIYGCLALRADGTVRALPIDPGDSDIPPVFTNALAVGCGGYSAFAVVGEGYPFITAQPLGRTIAPGADATFSLTAMRAWVPILANAPAAGPARLRVPYDPSQSQEFYRVAEGP